MTYRIRLAVLLACLGITIALTVTSACHAPVSVTTPQGKAAYTADQVVLRINELENAAITAQAQGQIPLATTRTIVEFCVSADKTLAVAPAGWPAIIATAWAQTKAQLPPITNSLVQSAMNAVDVVLAVEGGK